MLKVSHFIVGNSSKDQMKTNNYEVIFMAHQPIFIEIINNHIVFILLQMLPFL